MTVEEAKAILAKGSGWEDFGGPPFVIDGRYSLEELEAILVIARDAADRS